MSPGLKSRLFSLNWRNRYVYLGVTASRPRQPFPALADARARGVEALVRERRRDARPAELLNLVT